MTGRGDEPGPVSRALLDIIRDGSHRDELAARICRACVDGTDVDGAAVSVFTGSVHRETLAATDAVAELLEDLQFVLGEGVCTEAAVSGRPVLVPDLHDHGRTARWPMFADAVAEQTGVRGIFALPLRLGAINLGVLGLYRTTPGLLPEHELRDVVAAADTATLLLLEAERYGHGVHLLADRAREGPAGSQAEVHQATGMIVAQLGIPAQDAFVRLRAHAFARRRPLSDVAREVVARRLVFTEDME